MGDSVHLVLLEFCLSENSSVDSDRCLEDFVKFILKEIEETFGTPFTHLCSTFNLKVM